MLYSTINSDQLIQSPDGNEIQKFGQWLYEFCPSIGEVTRDVSKKWAALYWD
jgi:hypothetical protein